MSEGVASSVRLQVCLTGSGSAEFDLSIGDEKVTLFASHIFTDAVSELLGATLAAVSFGTPQTVVAFEEPGTYVIRLVPNADRLGVEVSCSPRPPYRSHASDRHIVFSAACRLRTFAGAVHAAAQALIAAHGARGYELAWGHAFPMDRMKELKLALERKSARRQGETFIRSGREEQP